MGLLISLYTPLLSIPVLQALIKAGILWFTHTGERRPCHPNVGLVIPNAGLVIPNAGLVIRTSALSFRTPVLSSERRSCHSERRPCHPNAGLVIRTSALSFRTSALSSERRSCHSERSEESRSFDCAQDDRSFDCAQDDRSFAEFESHYAMSSATFWGKYQNGLVPDEADYVEWHAFCKMRQRLQQRLAILRGDSL